jgi:uncharacterized protein YndB with AHSA1/START domain
MTDDALAPIEADIQITAPVAHVWKVLTEPDLVHQWLGCIDFQPIVGHIFYMQPDQVKAAAGDISGATHCEVESLDPPSSIVFSWYMPDTPKTHVTLSLIQRAPELTLVTLVHDGWDKFPASFVASIHEALSGGWRQYVLPNLKKVCEASG